MNLWHHIHVTASKIENSRNTQSLLQDRTTKIKLIKKNQSLNLCKKFSVERYMHVYIYTRDQFCNTVKVKWCDNMRAWNCASIGIIIKFSYLFKWNKSKNLQLSYLFVNLYIYYSISCKQTVYLTLYCGFIVKIRISCSINKSSASLLTDQN